MSQFCVALIGPAAAVLRGPAGATGGVVRPRPVSGLAD